ncbi:MAG TPA: hypothetical protein VMH81_08555 [Bryobacteraceae bacterium]|nr:hypothetical protein [Bryobacteraceae bacterium]
MTTSMTRLMIAAAALVVAAGSASAQVFKAEIPMAFTANGAVMQPGSYSIQTLGGAAPAYSLRNLETRNTILAVAASKSDTPKAWTEAGDPKLTFVCWEDGCALTGLWDGESSATNNFNYKHSTTLASRHTEAVAVAMIRVR